MWFCVHTVGVNGWQCCLITNTFSKTFKEFLGLYKIILPNTVNMNTNTALSKYHRFSTLQEAKNQATVSAGNTKWQ